MIKRNQRYFNWLNRLLDMAIIYGSYLLAVGIWIYLLRHDSGNVSIQLLSKQWILIIYSFFCIVVFQYSGLYDSLRSKKLAPEIGKLMMCHTICVIIAISFIFLLKIRDFSRGVMVSFYLMSSLLLIIKRLAVKLVLYIIRNRGLNQKHIIIVGDGILAEKFIENVEQNPQIGFKCAGYVGQDGKINSVKYLGAYDDFSSILENSSPDEVVIALEEYNIGLMNSILLSCEKHGLRVNIIPLYYDFLSPTATVDSIGSVRLINIRGISQDIVFNQFIKRVFDILFSALILILLSPLLIILAIGVKLSSPGPVLFRQTRVGKDGKLFTMYKFRSMTINDSADTAWTTNQDSRVTKFGAFIRKFSLDELPQFFNVLLGDMSVVGPRPELPYFVDQYKNIIPRYMVKHQVKPGVTGWAQVNGFRGDTSIEKRIDFDLWYMDNWSVLLDIKIIFMTVFGGMINSEQNMGRKEDT